MEEIVIFFFASLSLSFFGIKMNGRLCEKESDGIKTNSLNYNILCLFDENDCMRLMVVVAAAGAEKKHQFNIKNEAHSFPLNEVQAAYLLNILKYYLIGHMMKSSCSFI